MIFVGTGSGKTSLQRFHSSLLIKTVTHDLLIDTGDGISKALLNINVDFNSINSILITHYHADHFSGIASLVTQMKLQNRKEPLYIHTNKNLIPPLQSLLNATCMCQENLDYDLIINGYTFDKLEEICTDIQFKAKQNSHIRHKENMFVSASILFVVDGMKIFYTSDVGSAADLYLFQDEKIDYLITESTHITCDEILKSFSKLNPAQLFITHIADDFEEDLENWYINLTKFEQNRIKICFDGLTLTS